MKSTLRLIALASAISVIAVASGQSYKLQFLKNQVGNLGNAAPVSLTSKALLYQGVGTSTYEGAIVIDGAVNQFQIDAGIPYFAATFERMNDSLTVVGNLYFLVIQAGDGGYCGVGEGSIASDAYIRWADGSIKRIQLPNSNTRLSGISDNGVAVGGVETFDEVVELMGDIGYPYIRTRPLIVDKSGAHVFDLPLEEMGLTAASAELLDINNGGQMVGVVYDPYFGFLGSFFWNGKYAEAMPGEVAAINNGGHMVGTMDLPGVGRWAYVKRNNEEPMPMKFDSEWPSLMPWLVSGVFEKPGQLVQSGAIAYDINDRGQVLLGLEAWYLFTRLDGSVYTHRATKYAVASPSN